jgi:formylglycine-generating enzyme required for sulfatase activity
LPGELREEERWLELPVERVSWDDIQVFEERTGLTLPSEAQWEYGKRRDKPAWSRG